LAEAFHVPGISERVVGGVLNKVDISLLKRFESHDADARVGKYMESYRHTA
jgi:hypothetical protein